MPVVDSRTGAHLGLLKKVRLTVKLQRSKNFTELIQTEHQGAKRSGEGSLKDDSSSQRAEEQFEASDLILKSRQELDEEESKLRVDPEEAAKEEAYFESVPEDPNFAIDEDPEGEDLDGYGHEQEDEEGEILQHAEEATSTQSMEMDMLKMSINEQDPL